MNKLIDLGAVSEETKGNLITPFDDDGGIKFNCPNPLPFSFLTSDPSRSQPPKESCVLAD